MIYVFMFKSKISILQKLGRRPSQGFKKLDRGPRYWDTSIKCNSRRADWILVPLITRCHA